MPDPRRPSRPRRSPAAASAWDRQATWYDGWVGGQGSRYHQRIVLPVGLELLDPRLSRVVECRYFGGMSVEEAAEALQVSPATIKRDWSVARAWLNRELQG